MAEMPCVCRRTSGFSSLRTGRRSPGRRTFGVIFGIISFSAPLINSIPVFFAYRRKKSGKDPAKSDGDASNPRDGIDAAPKTANPPSAHGENRRITVRPAPRPVCGENRRITVRPALNSAHRKNGRKPAAPLPGSDTVRQGGQRLRSIRIRHCIFYENKAKIQTFV